MTSIVHNDEEENDSIDEELAALHLNSDNKHTLANAIFDGELHEETNYTPIQQASEDYEYETAIQELIDEIVVEDNTSGAKGSGEDNDDDEEEGGDEDEEGGDEHEEGGDEHEEDEEEDEDDEDDGGSEDDL